MAVSNVGTHRPLLVILQFIIATADDINLCYTGAAIKLGLSYRAVDPIVGSQMGHLEVDSKRVADVTVNALQTMLPTLTQHAQRAGSANGTQSGTMNEN